MNLVCESLDELFEERVLLRTLTPKSSLGFGSNGKFPISSLIKSMPGYLKWVYYTYEGITFTEDILDLLQIPLDRRIKKPGKDPDMWRENQTIPEKISKKAYLDKFAKEKNFRKEKRYGVKEDPAIQKGILQNMNRGIL